MNPLTNSTPPPLSLQTSRRTSLTRHPDSGSRSLTAALASMGPLPSIALFIGLADDQRPVLLNLADPSPSPVLVAADAGAGKTRLLQTIARALELTHDPGRARYVVLTEHPREWAAFEGSDNCDAVLAFHHALTTGYLASAVQRTTDPRSSSLVLLIDGFEALASDADLRGAAHELMHRTPPGLWPFITLNTTPAPDVAPFLAPFRFRLFGYIREAQSAAILHRSTTLPAGTLQPPSQFAVWEADHWLPFWLPDLD